MKKIFLHIGLRKTGSTTIQAFLHENKDNLLKSGYLYPKVGRLKPTNAHHYLVRLTQDAIKLNPNDETWQDLHQEIENSNLDKIIISSEAFGIANKKQIGILKTELQSYDVKIIVYLRRQDLRLESLYNQIIKNGKCLKDEVEDILTFFENKKRLFDYYQLLDPWKKAFGASNLIVRPLEKCQIPNLCHDILKGIGIDNFKHFREVNNKNIKVGRKALEVLRVAYHIWFINQDNSDKKYHQKEKKEFIRQIDALAREFWLQDNSKYRLLSYDYSAEILEKFHQSNQAVAREYLGREDGILFYEPLENYEPDDFKIEDLSKEELLRLILSVMKLPKLL